MLQIKKDKYIEFLEFITINRWKVPSQLSQDLFVLYFTEAKKNGFFLEIGACDGFRLSNTLFLEKYGCNGCYCI